MIKKEEYTSWKDLKNRLDEFGSEYVFRGHADESWGLKTSLERREFDLPHLYEQNVLSQIGREVSFYKDELSVLPENELSLLSLAQHYGVPTRLLDVTDSPYVASYFAFEENLSKQGISEVAIYAINYIQLLGQCHIYLTSLKDDLGEDLLSKLKEHNHNYSHPEIFRDLLIRRGAYINLVTGVSPYYKNQRIGTQQGHFLVVGNPKESFIDNLEAMPKLAYPIIYKLTLKTEDRLLILRDLQKMNISRKTMFPGLEGYIKSVGVKTELDIEPHLNYAKKLHPDLFNKNGETPTET